MNRRSGRALLAAEVIEDQEAGTAADIMKMAMIAVQQKLDEQKQETRNREKGDISRHSRLDREPSSTNINRAGGNRNPLQDRATLDYRPRSARASTRDSIS